MERCRTCHLDRVADARRVLTVGEGDGRLLVALLAAAPDARVTVVDTSAAMLALARGRLERERPGDVDRVEFRCADLLALHLPPREFDLVVSCFFLDCFEGGHLAAVVDRLGGLAAPTSAWLVADFERPTGGWRGLHASAWLVLLYGFFGLATGLGASRLESPAPHLQRQGFAPVARHSARAGLLAGSLWRRGGVGGR